MKMNKKKLIAVSTAGVLALVFIIYIFICMIAGGKDFVSNSTINGINVGNMTKAEAIAALQKQYDQDSKDLVLDLKVNDQSYKVDVKNCVSYNINAEVDRISNKYDSFLKKGYHYLFNHEETTCIEIKDKESLKKSIDASKITEYSTLVPTTYKVEKDKVVFTKGKSGDVVKNDNVYKEIENHLSQYQIKDVIEVKPTKESENDDVMKKIYKDLSKGGKDATLDKKNNYAIVAGSDGAKYDLDESISLYDKASEGEKFEIKAKCLLPKITKEMLEKNLFKDVLGEYSTYVSGSSVRKNNVRLAAQKCSGIILLPGESFSYNDSVGKRTKANGFGEAGAYVNGETVQEVGGGVCQTSSTLYNAVVLSNLEVTERSNHTYISSYVPIGRDATVSWGGPDFKFKNNQDYPIKIDMSYENSKLTMRIIGTNLEGIKVEFTSSRTGTIAAPTTYENDPSIPTGTEKVKEGGSSGATAVSYRKVYDKNGKLLSNKKEASSHYKPHKRVILRGTGPAVQPETPATPETPAAPTTPAASSKPSTTTKPSTPSTPKPSQPTTPQPDNSTSGSSDDTSN